MAKNRHHYVPQFYLRAFSSTPNRINLMNLKNRLVRGNVGIKGQCYKHKFYGENEKFEDALSIIERYGASVIREICKLGQLPPKDTDNNYILVTFVATQILRTSQVANSLQTKIDGMYKIILKHHPDFKDIDLENYTIGFDNPALASLKFVGNASLYIERLERALVYASGNDYFITSDNPAAKYNQYQEGFSHITGTTGLLAKGIQLFLPLSPKYLLVYYDKDIYNVKRTGPERVDYASSHDVRNLNILQIISAEENIYFNSMQLQAELLSLAKTSDKYRKLHRVIADEFPEEGRENHSSLIVSDEILPNLHLSLSFLKPKRSARKRTYKERIRNRYRDDPLSSDMSENQDAPTTTKIFKKTSEKSKR